MISTNAQLEEVALRLVLLMVLLPLLCSQPAIANDLDPACVGSGGLNTQSISGGLKRLTKCTKTYCGAITAKNDTRDNIKFLDEAIAAFEMSNERYSESVNKYTFACRALMKKYCSNCTLSEAVDLAVLSVQSNGGLAEQSAATLRDSESFANFVKVMTQDEGDLACSAQIVSLVNSAVTEHQKLSRLFGNTVCHK